MNIGFILPCGQNNPSESSLYAHPVAYVFHKDGRTRPTRAVQSGGDLGPNWAIGSRHRLVHDHTGESLGWYRVVGIAHYDKEGECMYTESEVPDRKMATAVFK
jgi:hypothetical protein